MMRWQSYRPVSVYISTLSPLVYSVQGTGSTLMGGGGREGSFPLGC